MAAVPILDEVERADSGTCADERGCLEAARSGDAAALPVREGRAKPAPVARVAAVVGRSDGRILMVGHLLEYHPAVNYIKGMIDSGELGDVYYLYSQRLNLGKVRSDENALWSLASHDISVALYLLGEEPVLLEDVEARPHVALVQGRPQERVERAHDEPEVRAAAMRANVHDESREFLDALLRALQSDAAALARYAAAEALGPFALRAELGEAPREWAERIARALMDRAEDPTEDYAVRGAALASVGYFSRPEVLTAVLAALEEPRL